MIVPAKTAMNHPTNHDRPAATAKLKALFARLATGHEHAGAALARRNDLTDNSTPPERAGNTFRALYNGPSQPDRQMHRHVHQENNVLLPRALAGGGAL
jgi:iron-sulfur cluster repair protein YtfE (RIC family)